MFMTCYQTMQKKFNPDLTVKIDPKIKAIEPRKNSLSHSDFELIGRSEILNARKQKM